jgi:hypothetical protein
MSNQNQGGQNNQGGQQNQGGDKQGQQSPVSRRRILDRVDSSAADKS